MNEFDEMVINDFWDMYVKETLEYIRVGDFDDNLEEYLTADDIRIRQAAQERVKVLQGKKNGPS